MRSLPLALVIAVPGVIISIVRNQVNFLGGLWALFIVILFPVFILSIVGLISWVIMKSESMIRQRGLVLFLANILLFSGLIVLSLMLNSVIYPMLANLGKGFIYQVLGKWVVLVSVIAKDFFPINWAVQSIITPSIYLKIIYFILLMVLNSISGFVFLTVVSATYYTLGQKLSLIPEAVRSVKVFNVGGKIGQLLQREWWILNNEYFFLAEGFAELFIGPLLILIFGLFTIFSRPLISQFDSILNMIQKFIYLDFAFVILLVLLATMNTVGPTGISREGRYFYISKVIPVPYGIQYYVKFIFSSLFSGGAGVIAFMGVLLLGLNIKHPLLVLFAVVSLIILIETNVLFFDMHRPNLNWNHPQQAMNSNFNVALNMIWVFGALAVIGGLGFLGVIHGVKFSLILFCLAIIALLSGYLVLRTLGERAESYYKKIG